MTLLFSLIASSSFIIILSTALVQHYASPGTSLKLRLLILISFALGFSGIALLPIDLSHTTTISANSNNHTSVETQDSADFQKVNELYWPWQVTFWLTFVLAWIILPIAREYLQSGYFTISKRLNDATRKVCTGHVILVILLIIVIIALSIYLHSWSTAIPVLMAVGNTYGLLLVSLLLGYGLVDLPRHLWRCANPLNELRQLQIMANAADEALCDSVWELQDCEDDIDLLVDLDEDDIFFNYCLEDLRERRDSTAMLDPELQSRRLHKRAKDDSQCLDIESSITIETLAKLNARLKRAQAKLVSCEQRWTSLVEKSELFSDIVQQTLTLPSLDENNSSSCCSRLYSKWYYFAQNLRYLWCMKLRYYFLRISSMLTAILSLLVLWSETTMILPFELSPFSLLLHLLDATTNHVLFEILALVPLLYMSICVYRSLFKVQLFGLYALRGYKQSPGVALVFNAQYLVRMQFSLGYNYLLMLKYFMSQQNNCAFLKLMDHMSTVPFFGTSFSFYAPFMICIICCITIYNIYPKLLSILGIDHEDMIFVQASSDEMNSQVNEGILLLKKRKSNKKDVQNANDTTTSRSRSELRISESQDSIENENNSQAKKFWWHNVV